MGKPIPGQFWLNMHRRRTHSLYCQPARLLPDYTGETSEDPGCISDGDDQPSEKEFCGEDSSSN